MQTIAGQWQEVSVAEGWREQHRPRTIVVVPKAKAKGKAARVALSPAVSAMPINSLASVIRVLLVFTGTRGGRETGLLLLAKARAKAKVRAKASPKANVTMPTLQWDPGIHLLTGRICRVGFGQQRGRASSVTNACTSTTRMQRQPRRKTGDGNREHH
jgi:hypothetical protein